MFSFLSLSTCPPPAGAVFLLSVDHIGERASSGVPDVFKTWADQGWEEPVIEERFGAASRTVLTLSLKEKQRQKSVIKNGDKNRRQKSAINDREISPKTIQHLDTLLAHMESGKLYRAQELMDVVGLQVSRTRDLLNLLVKQGRIEKIGDNKNRRYQKRDPGPMDPSLKDGSL